MDDDVFLAFDLAPVGLVLSENRTVRTCNNSFCELVGHPKSALIGQRFLQLYSTESEFHQIRDVGLSVLSQGLVYRDERMLRHADGQRIWCRFRARSLTPDSPLRRVIMSFAPLDTPLGMPQLTPRERDVVSWLARGKTSKEIARILGLSPRTIEDVRARLLRKFKVRNIATLLARLGDKGP